MAGQNSRSEDDSDAPWQPGTSNTGDSGDVNWNKYQTSNYSSPLGDHHPRDSTLLITNLPRNTTMQDLMKRITIAGPFGRVYAVHLEKKPSVQMTTRGSSSTSQAKTTTMRRGGGDCPTQPEVEVIAYLAFFARENAEYFLAYVSEIGLCIAGRPMTVRRSTTPVPETLIIAGKDHSRALLIEGPHTVTLYNIERVLARIGLQPRHEQDLIIETVSDTRKEAYLLLTSYEAASKALREFNSLSGADVSAVYARDPVETGVKAVVNRTNDGQGRSTGQLEIVWRDW